MIKLSLKKSQEYQNLISKPKNLLDYQAFEKDSQVRPVHVRTYMIHGTQDSNH